MEGRAFQTFLLQIDKKEMETKEFFNFVAFITLLHAVFIDIFTYAKNDKNKSLINVIFKIDFAHLK